LGHEDLSTTVIYTHVLNSGRGAVRSPGGLRLPYTAMCSARASGKDRVVITDADN
jgi:hypothetical protein